MTVVRISHRCDNGADDHGGGDGVFNISDNSDGDNGGGNASDDGDVSGCNDLMLADLPRTQGGPQKQSMNSGLV